MGKQRCRIAVERFSVSQRWVTRTLMNRTKIPFLNGCQCRFCISLEKTARSGAWRGTLHSGWAIGCETCRGERRWTSRARWDLRPRTAAFMRGVHVEIVRIRQIESDDHVDTRLQSRD